ncbi:hypothetical protein IPO96_05230 [Candidatus Saccharibacteria bacterium]|nr:MAG: hypothetical protein IPO96_05230 [Candidatus Saccharibacteria bacterium]
MLKDPSLKTCKRCVEGSVGFVIGLLEGNGYGQKNAELLAESIMPSIATITQSNSPAWMVRDQGISFDCDAMKATIKSAAIAIVDSQAKPSK